MLALGPLTGAPHVVFGLHDESAERLISLRTGQLGRKNAPRWTFRRLSSRGRKKLRHS